MNADAEHSPDQPSWKCRVCGKPWPCEPARGALMLEGDGVTRSVYLSVQLRIALMDMPTEPADELYRRFLGWVRSG